WPRSFISRKRPSRCIFFFNALRAWSTLLSRTKTCTLDSFWIRGRPRYGYGQFLFRWQLWYEPRGEIQLSSTTEWAGQIIDSKQRGAAAARSPSLFGAAGPPAR